MGQRENLIISLEIFSTNWKQNYNLSEVVGYSKICRLKQKDKIEIS